MKATVLGIECDGSDTVGVILRLPEGAEVKKGDILVRPVYTPPWTFDEAEGEYIGPEERFKGRRALLQVHERGLVKAQFHEGEPWETHSWLTFDAEDWEFETRGAQNDPS